MSNIRLAKTEDRDDLGKLYDSCTQFLLDQGMDHWTGVYPVDKIEEFIDEKKLYLYTAQDNTLVGAIRIDEIRPWYYKDEEHHNWQKPSAKALHINGLAVNPLLHGKGYATKLLEYAEQKAYDEKIGFIRLDCVQGYSELVDFYTNKGYNIKFSRDFGEYKFYFFEKNINGTRY